MNIKLGHKAGSGSQRKPVTAPDSASSKSYARIVYGINDGHMVGFIDGLKSLILDNTPVQSSSGEMNITEVEVQTRWGTNDQDYLEGFPSVVNEIGYSNVEIVSDHNFVHYVNDLNTNAVGVRFTWGKIFRQNESNGDINGYRIDYAIDVQTDGNGFVEVLKTSLNDKTSSGYERYHRLELPPAEVGWEIRVRRLTPNATSDFIGDKMFLSAVAEIVDAKLRYPNTALIALKFDADKFGSIPKADFRLRGKIIKVPTNYDPETRTYAVVGEGTTNGIWDGSFKLAYTNNPVWIFYDLLLSKRYGLGERLDASMVDKWALYSIGQYCDVMVPDGMGGTEPRLTCNVYINSKYEAFDLLMQLASTFRGILHWDGASIVATADRPSDPVFTFTRANIIGEFNYSGTRARDRSSMISVAFDDPANNYKTDKEVVSDTNAIAEVGVRLKELTAFGCTSRGQAQRIGRLGLLKEQQELRMVTFTVGLDGYIPVTGKIIEIADPLLAGRAIGGRISVVSADGTVITLDREVTANVGDVLVANGDDGIQQRRDITHVVGNTVTVSAAFSGVSAENVWAIDSEDLSLMRFRVLSVAQNRSDDGLITFTISGVQHNPTIDEGADFSAYIEQPTYSNIEIYTQVAPTELVIGSENVINQGLDITNVVFSWPQAVNAVKYELEWRRDNGSWIKAPIIYSNTFVVEDVYHGLYEARIVAINSMDVRSLYTIAQPTTINSKFAEPPMLSFIQATGIQFGAEISWVFPARESQNAEYVEVQISYREDKTDAKLLGNYAYPLNRAEINGLQANLKLWVKARIIDRNKVEGPWTIWVSTTTDADASILLDALNGKITSSQLDQDLNQSIILGSGAAQTAEAAQNAANAAALAATNAQAAADQASTKAQEAANAVAQEAINRAAALQDGITQVTTDYRAGDAVVLGELVAYKTSNDSAMATVVQKAESAVAAGSTNSQAITELTGQVQAINNTKLDASAISNYYTKGQADDKSAEIAAGKIESYDANLVIGGTNLFSFAGAVAGFIAPENGAVVTTSAAHQSMNTLIPLGSHKSMTYQVWNPARITNTTNINRIAFFKADGSFLSVTIVPGLNGTTYQTTLIQIPDAATHARLGVLAGPVSGDRDEAVKIKIEFGNKATDWSPNNVEIQQAINANSTAIQSTSADVSLIDGKVNAQATDLLNLSTGLTNLNNTKLDAAIIQQYRTAVDQDSVTSGALTQFKSALKIGGDNLFTGTKTFNNQASENGTSSFYPRYGGFGGNTQEFLPNALFGTHTVVKTSSSWCGFYLREADGVSWEAKEDMVLSFWANASADVHVYGIDSQLGHLATITANQPMTKYEVLIPKGKPLRNASNQGIIEFNFPNGGELWYGAVMLQVGTKSTSWQPSSKESDTAVGSLATALTQTNTRVGHVEDGIASQANQLTSLSAKLNERKIYQLYSGGLEAVEGMGRIEGFDPNSYYGIGRSYGLVVFNGDGSIQSVNSYDVFGGHPQGFIDAVSAVPTGTYVAVLTSDEPQSNSANIKEALKSLGGSDAIDQLVYRGAYLLVGRKGLPSGQAIEKVSNTRAFGVDYLLEMYNGVPIGLGGSSPQAGIISNMRTEVSNLNGQVSSLAQQTSTLSTTVGSNTAAIQLQQSSIDGINAKATLQVEAGGTIGGVALGNNGGVVDFLVRANTFAIAPPVGSAGSNKYAFQYRSTPVSLPNGTVVSEGLYLNNLVVDYIDASKIYATSLSAISADLGTIKVGSANIADLAVTTAKIGDLQVDTLKIKDNAVTVPVYSYTSGIAYIDSSRWITSQSIWAPCSNGVTLFFFNFSYDCRRQDTRYAVKCRILKDGVIVRPEFTIFYFEADANSVNVKSRPAGTLSLNHADDTGVDGTFELQFYVSAGNGWNVDNRYTSSLTVRK